MHKSLKINRLYSFFLFFLLFFFFTAGLLGCSKETNFSKKASLKDRSLSLHDAKNFQIDSIQEGILGLTVRVFIGKDTTEYKYLLAQKDKKIPDNLKNIPIIQIPIKRAVALSGSHYTFFKHLNEASRIIAFSDKRYAADSLLYNEILSKKIESVGEGPSLNQEKIYSLKPDIVITFATGSSFDSNLDKIKALGIPVLYVSEWQESTPLGKAEWLRLFGILTENNKADSLFNIEKTNYENLKKIIQEKNVPCKPVLLGGPVSGYWFAPGDLGYTASLIRDANGCHVLKSISLEQRLSLENAFSKAEQAEIWLHPGVYDLPEKLLTEDPRLKQLKPFKEKQVYNFDLKKGPSGALDFYESAVVKPSEVLADIINIFYPGTLPKKKLTWYRNIFYN